jgi:uncharacterized protein YggT (Ycf19 family)
MPYMGGVDLSPVVAYLAITFLQSFVVASVMGMGLRMKSGGI